ncbi:helix-turn-helix transcriptional regulator [Methanosphaera sp. WGK6]|uniref:helix-turn-helix transcriptional regulator n=1 Tax=Methanosphaera sp. WGK6 TaxID=1561964 RepID=UPI00084BF98A|nr:hypothetical protein [Methanosphaera sp. WGK6]OED29552.1 hypothetical protein NL43_07635 [Methanosphaera sp. WGK6]
MKTKINYFVKNSNLNQEQILKKINISQKTWDAIIDEKYVPTLLTAHKITKALNCNHIDEVFFE